MAFWKSDIDNNKFSTINNIPETIDSNNSNNLSVQSKGNSEQNDFPFKGENKFTKIRLLPKKRLQTLPINMMMLKTEKVTEQNHIVKTSPLIVNNASSIMSIKNNAELLKLPEPAGSHNSLEMNNILIPPEESNLFKKREIKCRNIRKSDMIDTIYHIAVSPPRLNENNIEEDELNKNYPKSWAEHKDFNLSAELDGVQIKHKSLIQRNSKFEFRKYFSFESPSVPIEMFKSESKNRETCWIPFSYLKCTGVSPSILYSTNRQQNSHLTKKQLYAMIPQQRIAIIEELGAPKNQIIYEDHPVTTSRKWYSNNWEKSTEIVTESSNKVLDHSVGLSFLQSYAEADDEAEDEHPNDHTEKQIENYQIFKASSSTDDQKSANNVVEVVEEKLTPEGSPDAAVSLNVIKSKWDEPSAYSSDENDEDHTPPPLPLDNSDILIEAHENILENIVLEYEKTKGELNQLEEVLKTTNYLKTVKNDALSEKTADKKDKRKRSKNLNRSSKKRRHLSSSSEAEISDQRRKSKKKHKKQKKESRYERSSRKMNRSNKSKKKIIEDSCEDDYAENSRDSQLLKKNKNKQKFEKHRIRHSSEDSAPNRILEQKILENIIPEDYEDDMKFFAERFDAEKELRGKGGKHKTTKTIIALDELSIHLKINENDENPEIEMPILKNNEAGEKILKGETPKKETKVDLLKMNEEYLKEQKKKEVEVVAEEPVINEKDNNVALIEIKPENVEAKIIISNLDSVVKAEPNVEVENPCTDDAAPILDDLNLKTEMVPAKEVAEDDPKVENKELSEMEALTLLNIKKEDVNFEVETLKTFVKNNSWESEDEEEESASTPTEADEDDDSNETIRPTPPDFNLPLEIIPLNIEPFIKRDLMKVEKPLLAAESSPQKIIRIVDDPDFFDIETEIPISEKQKSWTESSLLSIIKQEAPDEDDNNDVIALGDINNSNTSEVLLENEYEEFMKAVSNKDLEAEEASGTNPNNNDENNEQRKDEAKEIEKLVDSHIIKIEPPQESNFKPIPVPSPAKKEPVVPSALINQPLINLSLSANVTQNFTLSLSGTTTNLPTISTPSITSSINISKPNVELISTAGSLDTTGSTLMDFSLSGEKPVFETLTLPTTKKLLDNSKLLNLDDSDSQDRCFEKETTTKKNRQQKLSVNEKIEENPPSEMWPIMENKHNSKKSNRNNERRSSISKNRHNEPLPIIRRNRRDLSPILLKRRRDSSPPQRRRFSSPLQQRRRSPKRSLRSPLRRKRSSSPRNRRLSPKQRQRSFSPRGKRSISPMMMRRPSLRSPSSPHHHHHHQQQQRQKRFRTGSCRRSFTPNRDLSPSSSSLKRNNVPDSTISDEFLQRQQYHEPLRAGDDEGGEERGGGGGGGGFSPKRLPLDVRINQVLGMENSSGQTSPRPYCCNEIIQPHPDYLYDEETTNYEMCSSSSSSNINRTPAAVQSNYRQVGNMLQILPNDDVVGGLHHHHQMQMHHHQLPSSIPHHHHHHQYHHQNNYEAHPVPTDLRSKIVQVGNMLQIVPAEMPNNSIIMHPSEVKNEPAIQQEKSSSSCSSSVAEAAMLKKAAERRAEREQRRQEREKRRKEKEKRRKEKERAKQAKLNVVTENMIKRALELEIEEEEAAAAAAGEQADLQPQWPPAIISSSVNKEAGKSILINKQSSENKSSSASVDKKSSKLVQFADGIRPGEGTSPSAGEELSSPPPPPPKKKLPKEKRFKKLNFHKKQSSSSNKKRKVKVKVIKKPPPPSHQASSPAALRNNNNESNSDEDNLPPPSPPPGSPPPHIFPPRLKVHTVNNVPGPYLASIIQNVPQQTNQSIPFQANLYRPQINMMAHPPPGHIPSVSPLTGSVSSSHLSGHNRHF